jgi:hypothetical protein
MRNVPSWRVAIGALTLLFLRSIVLLFLIPACLISWPIVLGVTGKDITLGQWMGWADWNIVAAMQRGLLPLIPEPLRWLPWGEIARTSHRVGIFRW